MYLGFILTPIFLLVLPQLYQLKSIPKDVDGSTEYNFNEFEEVYDQKQNGSFNVRVGIDGVNVLWQPDPKFTSGWVDALLETALIGIVESIPFPSSTEKPAEVEDFFKSSPAPIESNKNEDKMGEFKGNKTTEAEEAR